MIGLTMADRKHFPAVRKFLMNTAVGSGTRCIRVDRELSGQNRRLYRQSRIYRTKVNLPGERSGTSIKLDVYKLRDSFMLQKGYALAMKSWNDNYEAAEHVVKDNVRARWRDFRIDIRPFLGDLFLNSYTLSANGTGVSATLVQVDEYGGSLVYDPINNTSKDFGLRTDSNTYDIISEYNKLGKVQSQPSTQTTQAAYEELNPDLIDSNVTLLQTDGNAPPYDADSTLPGEILEYVGTIYRNPEGNEKLTTGYFDAPLGAVYVFGVGASMIDSITQDGEAAPVTCEIEVQAGDYKGVKAIPYVDAKALGSGN